MVATTLCYIKARMATYLYRRDGWFHARLRVPLPLVNAYGKTLLRTSLETADYRQARLRVLEVVLSWKRDFLRVQAMLDARQVVAGSALLLGDGLTTIESAARECGLRVDTILREAINRAVELRLEALGWQGSEVPINELEADYDGATLPDDTLAGRELGSVFGTLYVRREALPLIHNDLLVDCVFFRDAARLQAVVFPFPGMSVPVGGMLIEKQDAEAIRAGIAACVTPAMLDAAAARRARQAQPAPVSAHKYGTMRASVLMSEFFKARSDWSEATKIQMIGMCGIFVELMEDPTLSEIDGVMLLDYRRRLLTLPRDIYQTKRRLKTDSLAALVVAAAGLPQMLEARADAYLGKAGEMFAWAARNGFMPSNPAAGAVGRKKKTVREQDAREEFSDENLRLIFSSPWFAIGKGERVSPGEYSNFRSFHYWLALLGLYTGGRLNELSQLHLKDIQRTAAGQWFIDFNLEGSGKIDEPDKRLKTVNSIRKVPMHPELVRLGLPEYVQALANAGYGLLFPELRFDRVKGYGKAAGQWFNEKFLGVRLEIPRDGMQTFHSFRHSFISGLYRLDDPSLGEFVINQLSGHERGETMSAKRYSKDQGPDTLSTHVARLNFSAPVIEAFDIQDGLFAVRDGLKRRLKSEAG